MEFVAIIVGVIIWLIVFWVGSIALERTGMDRRKARFQTLSAVTGTGFTTYEAESVVNHPHRRKIIGRLIFLGNTAFFTFLIGVIVFIVRGPRIPNPTEIGILIGISVTIFLIIILGGHDKVADRVLKKRRMRKIIHPVSDSVSERLIYKAGRYGVVRILLKKGATVPDSQLEDGRFTERKITVLALERKDEVISLPKADETVFDGDSLLCYGEISELLKI